MPLVSCGYLPIPAPLGATGVGANILIDAINEMAFSAWSVSRSGGGTISHVHFRTNTVTTGATLFIRIETLDGNGDPSGTLWATDTSATQVVDNTDDNVLFRVALTAGATVALGDQFAVLVQQPGSGAGNLNIARAPITVGSRGFPFAGGPLASGMVDLTGPHCALEYDDGFIELPPGILPGACTPATVSLSTATNPDEFGLHFAMLFPARVIGFWLHVAASAALTYRMSLYESGNNTPLATATMDTDLHTSTGARIIMAAWDDVATAPTLNAGTTYRLACVALSGTAITVYRVTAYNNAWFDTLGIPGAQETSRNRSSTTDPDSASWTETSTQRPQMGLMIDQISDGAGGT